MTSGWLLQPGDELSVLSPKGVPVESLKIDDQIGTSGRTGSIYKAVDSLGNYWAVKIYHRPDELFPLRHGISIYNFLNCDNNTYTPKAALPLFYVARKGTPDHIGFMMELFETSKHFIPISRLLDSPNTRKDPGFVQGIANSLIRDIEAIHKAQLLAGDISGNNILVNNEKEVVWVDVDSWASSLFDPKHRSPGYKPADTWNLSGKHSDWFGITILIAQLLSLAGLHPFGKEKKNSEGYSLQDRIEEGQSWIVNPGDYNFGIQQVPQFPTVLREQLIGILVDRDFSVLKDFKCTVQDLSAAYCSMCHSTHFIGVHPSKPKASPASSTKPRSKPKESGASTIQLDGKPVLTSISGYGILNPRPEPQNEQVVKAELPPPSIDSSHNPQNKHSSSWNTHALELMRAVANKLRKILVMLSLIFIAIYFIISILNMLIVLVGGLLGLN